MVRGARVDISRVYKCIYVCAWHNMGMPPQTPTPVTWDLWTFASKDKNPLFKGRETKKKFFEWFGRGIWTHSRVGRGKIRLWHHYK